MYEIDYLTLNIKPTILCNLNCEYCYQKSIRENFKNHTMSKKILKEIFVKTSKLKVKNIDFQWIGGETLLPGINFYSNAINLSKTYLKEKKIKHLIQTNGTLFSDEWIDFLLKNENYIKLSLSFDCFSEVYRKNLKNRNYNDVFEKIDRNIKLLKRNNISFGILVTISQDSLKIPAEKWFNFWIEYDLKWIGLQLNYSDIYSSKKNNDYVKYIDFIKKIVNLQHKYNLKNKTKKIFIRETLYLFNKIFNLNGQYWGSSCHNNNNICNNNLLSVDMDGNVYCICDAFVKGINKTKEYVIGNILYSNFFDMIKSKNYEKIQDKFFKLKKICLKCDIYEYCFGGCPVFKTNNFNFDPNCDYCGFFKAYFSLITDKEYKKIIKELYI